MSSKDGRYVYLLLALLTLTILFAFLGPNRVHRLVVDVAFFVVLVPSIQVVSVRRGLRTAGIVVGVLAMLANLVHVLPGGSLTLATVRSAFIAAFLALTIVAILIDVFRVGAVTWNKIFGAISVYLLVGFCWAFLYWLIDAHQPGAFSLPFETVAAPRTPGPNTDFVYFSFVTLTTLGYGDILPVAPAARTLSWIQAVFGQIYLAVLVARLVGLHIVHSGLGAPGREE